MMSCTLYQTEGVCVLCVCGTDEYEHVLGSAYMCTA